VKFRTLTCVIILAVLTIPTQLIAQQIRYKLIDIPTLGGPAAIGQVDGQGISQFINNPGVVVGGSDIDVPDPFCLNPGCFTPHAFRWKDGVLTDLGSLDGASFSHATSVNARGWITGGSFMSDFDPLKKQPVEHAVLWKDGKINDLGTLGTGLESAALYVNNPGEVVGFSTFDTTPDPFSFLGAAIHAFIWRHGVMQDLGTLGGRDSFPAGGCNNQRAGLVAGASTTSSGESHAFLWDNGTMTDIPTLGGTSAVAQCANNAGQVIGFSNLTGDEGCNTDNGCAVHTFSWDHGTLQDLGTLGGTSSIPVWLNNNGEAVGGALTTGNEEVHATLWKNGQITDLNRDGDCFSFATGINSHHQIIGNTFNCETGTFRMVLWRNGSIIDLNAATASDSKLFLIEPDNINDRGEIVGRGVPPGCDNLDLCGHVFLLIPCDHAGNQQCEEHSDSARTAATKQRHAAREFLDLSRARFRQPHQVSRARQGNYILSPK